MLHKYRKTALIEAERFDGSIDMMREYGIVANPDALHDTKAPLYVIYTKEGEMIVHEDDLNALRKHMRGMTNALGRKVHI